jgi:hypothetical protein
MPGWKAVESSPAADAFRSPKADSVGVDLSRLREKYFGEETPRRGADAGAAVSPVQPVESDDAHLVVMEQPAGSDYSPGRKTVLVRGNKVIGIQG